MTTHADAPNLFSGLGRVVVLVADQDATLAFYRDALGFRVLHDHTADGYRYLHIGLPGQDGVGLWLMPAADEPDRALVGRQSGAQPLLVLYTPDLDTVRTHLHGHGVRTWNDREDRDSRSLHLEDLDGNELVAVQLRTPGE
ncbi:VOC family protein [Kitasatospora sp. NPDC101235]|uniref:VOC family protein n=1 Tax=Kitasatospora sp. NPDC101235 TaxID=3364101 RepID=UPI003812D190